MVGRKLDEFSAQYDPLTIAQRESAQLQRRVDELETRIREDGMLAALYTALQASPSAPPKWLVTPPKKSKRPPVIATAFLSDTHFDEVVDPRQINGVNAYNRAIAERRIRRFFEKTITLSDRYLGGFAVEGMVLPLGGDMVSGNIHEELRETNEAAILETCLHWSDQLQSGIEMLAEHFPRLHVPCVVGNHGRLDKKPRAKGKVQDNFDWLIYELLARRKPKNVTFQVELGSDVKWNAYQHRYQMTHGNQFTGGKGWGGFASPIMRGDDAKRKREQTVRQPYDTLIMGHFHQLRDFGRIVVNGSVKGYDEWASDNNYDFEPPQQAFWLTDPTHGRILSSPIFVADDETYAQPAEVAA